MTSSSVSSRLSGSSRSGALAILDEYIDALNVYGRALENRSLGRATTTYYNRKSHDLPNHPAIEMATEELNFEKLKQDSHWLKQLLISTKKCLHIDGNLDVLIDEVAKNLKAQQDENEILSRAQELEKKLRHTRQNITEERQRRDEEEKRLRTELARLKNQQKILDTSSRAETDYVVAWLSSRHEQRDLVDEITRRRLTMELQRCEAREINERLVTRQLDEFFRRSVEENEKSTQDWTERKSLETKQYEREIDVLRDEIEKKRAALEELRKEYDDRSAFIDLCLAEKEAERSRHELEEHRRVRAVTIQAWWRGVMVRRKLGPYRSDDKKRKKPIKGKK